jgi:hypothetical protein
VWLLFRATEIRKSFLIKEDLEVKEVSPDTEDGLSDVTHFASGLSF